MIIPKNFDIANAYGAACAEISFSIEKIDNFNDEKISYYTDYSMNELKKMGVAKDIKIIEKKIIPFYYMNSNIGKIKITVSGSLI